MRPAPLLEWVPPPPQHNTRDMHRRDDHATSIAASERIAKSCKTELQAEVLAAFVEFGPMTDGEMERLERFSHLGPSTARKRRGELCEAGLVEDTGTTRKHGRSSMIVWRAVTA